jgi:ribosomal protein L3 glutamine methyltransferase
MIRYAVTSFRKNRLEYGQGTTSALEDASFLVLEGLRLPVADSAPWLDARLTAVEQLEISRLIHSRVTERRPVAYLLNTAYFHGDPYYVDDRVIIPRSFIGEILLNPEYVDRTPEALINPTHIRRVLDLCTGSGCLAVLASRVFDVAELIHASDVSADCIAVANRNVKDLELSDVIKPVVGDMFQFAGATRYDLIICNPPYVNQSGMDELPAEYKHEPRLALQSGPNGMEFLTRLLLSAHRHLSDKGKLLCEVGLRRPDIEAAFPELSRRLLWLDTEQSEGEVFFVKRADLLLINKIM